MLDGLRDFFAFALANKKLWMIPLVLVLMIIGLVIVAQGTVVAPFIYTLF